MSLIQEALKRQEEEQKLAEQQKKSAAENVGSEYNSSELYNASSLDDSENLSGNEYNTIQLDDESFILPEDFEISSSPIKNENISPIIPKDEKKTLLVNKEEQPFVDTAKTSEPNTHSDEPEEQGGLKLQKKETPKKLYEEPQEEAPKSKKKTKNKKKEDVKSSVPVHPVLNRGNAEEQDKGHNKKDDMKIMLFVLLFIVIIVTCGYLAFILIGSGDFSSLTKYVSKNTSSSKSQSSGTINVSKVNKPKENSVAIPTKKVVDNPKSVAGKAINKAEGAAEKIQSAGKTQLESIAKENSVAVSTKTEPPVDTKASASEQTAAVEDKKNENNSNFRLTEKIKARLEAKRRAEERNKNVDVSQKKNIDIKWPKVTLSGTIGMSEHGAAIFDGGKIVNTGETYKEMKLIDVGRDGTSGVILEYKGEQRFLSTGQSF